MRSFHDIHATAQPLFPMSLERKAESAGSSRSPSPDDNLPSDQEIVRRVLGGERQAFEGILLRHERAIYFHLLRMVRRREDAEDLTQETFLRALRGLAGYRPTQPFRPWLYRVATNLAISSMRRRRPQIISLDEEQGLAVQVAAAPGKSPADQLEQEQMIERLERAVAALPVESAALFNMRYRAEMSFEEIGASLDRKPATVCVALHRLRLRLRKIVFAHMIEKEGGGKS